MPVRGVTKNVLIAPGAYKDLDPEENYAPNYIDLRNGYITDKGSYHKRHGFLQKNDLGIDQPVDLLIPEGPFGYAVTKNGRVFRLTSDSTQIQMTGAVLNGSFRPKYAKHSDIIVICDGGNPVKIDSGNTSLLGGSPSKFKYIIILGDYLLGAGHDATEIKWTAANNPENWTTGDSGFANVTKNGTIKNMVNARKRAYVFKDNEIEIWTNRGGAIQFTSIETIEKGIFGNGDSLIKDGDALYFLGDDRRFYRLDGVAPVPISSPLESYVQNLGSPDECYGFNCKSEHLLRWFFPTDGVTLVYDYKNSTPQRPLWWEDNVWDRGQFRRMPFASYMEINKKQYFGSYNLDGLLYEWSKNYLDDNGLPIREFRHFAIESESRKLRFNKLGFYLKRAVATAAVSSPVFMWRYKTDRKGIWSPWDELDMGAAGDANPYIERRNLGTGRNIEFQIAQSDAVETFLRKMDLTARELAA